MGLLTLGVSVVYLVKLLNTISTHLRPRFFAKSRDYNAYEVLTEIEVRDICQQFADTLYRRLCQLSLRCLPKFSLGHVKHA